MARKFDEAPRPAELQRFSRAFNKTRVAAIMAVVGVGFLAAARLFLDPQWVQIALAVFLVGVVSALFSVGGTYLGPCPHCGAKVPYAHTFGTRRFVCRRCAGPIAVQRTADGLVFRRP